MLMYLDPKEYAGKALEKIQHTHTPRGLTQTQWYLQGFPTNSEIP